MTINQLKQTIKEILNKSRCFLCSKSAEGELCKDCKEKMSKGGFKENITEKQLRQTIRSIISEI